MHDNGIFRDTFGSRQLTAKILSVLAIGQTCQFQIVRLLNKIKRLRFISLFFGGGNYPCVALTCSSPLISTSCAVGHCVLFCNVFQIVKVGSSTLLSELSFRYGFYLVRVVRVTDVHVAWLVYVRTYCVPIVTLNFDLGDAQIKGITISLLICI